MFVDEAVLQVAAGKGGRGIVSFLHEKNRPMGGPDGGDGGDGGHVVLVADRNVRTLAETLSRTVWEAGNGQPGSGSECAGRNGISLTLRIPMGTLVYDSAGGALLTDLSTDGASWVAARGGRGGRGNARFKTATFQSPRIAEPGEEGERRELRLELKLLADAGLIGMPNAGKSTLLSRISAARPRVAAYPFTTLEPNLGTVLLDDAPSVVFADLPGLIEGASQGTGLGFRFLRHVERTSVLVHLVDCADEGDPLARYETVRRELSSYSPVLGERPEVVVGTKMDVSGAREGLARLQGALPGRRVLGVSGVSGEGIPELMALLVGMLRGEGLRRAV